MRFVRMSFWDALGWSILPALVPEVLALVTFPLWNWHLDPYTQAYVFCLLYPTALLIIGFIRWKRPMKIKEKTCRAL